MIVVLTSSLKPL